MELKLFSLIIADIREQQEEQFESYEIDISILKDLSNHNDFYNYIKDVTLKLENRRIDSILFKIEPKGSEKQIYIDYLDEDRG